MNIKRIPALDYLKGALICFVILIHSNTYLQLKWEDSLWFAYIVQLAVPMFMVLSGFTFSISQQKYKTLNEYYSKKVLVPKLLRFIFPVIVEEIIWAVARIVSGQREGMLIELLRINCGPGSYYFLLMIELVLVFPFIYFSVVKWGGYSVACLVGANFAFEVFATFINISPYWYARSLFAFSGFIAVGAYYYLQLTNKMKFKVIPLIFQLTGIMCSILWICATTWDDYKPVIFTKNPIYALPVLGWTSALVFIVILLGIKYNNTKQNLLGKICSEIGKASYHILCTQMVWFITVKWIKLHCPFAIKAIWWAPISVVLSVLAGVLFYYVEKRVSSRILKRLGY